MSDKMNLPEIEKIRKWNILDTGLIQVFDGFNQEIRIALHNKGPVDLKGRTILAYEFPHDPIELIEALKAAREVIEFCRMASEPYNDVKPRDWGPHGYWFDRFVIEPSP